MIWKLFMNDYPERDMEIERDIGDPDYLPDVVCVDIDGQPVFWGESGRMKPHKALHLLQRYPDAHIVHCRWEMDIDAFAEPFFAFVASEMEAGRIEDPRNWWKGKLEFASLPLDVWRFIDEDTGTILIDKKDVDWKVLDAVALSTELETIMKEDE